MTFPENSTILKLMHWRKDSGSIVFFVASPTSTHYFFSSSIYYSFRSIVIDALTSSTILKPDQSSKFDLFSSKHSLPPAFGRSSDRTPSALPLAFLQAFLVIFPIWLLICQFSSSYSIHWYLLWLSIAKMRLYSPTTFSFW